MNGLAILSGTYGVLAAFMVVGKIRFHHYLKLKGSVRKDLVGSPTINKEATDDYIDLMTVILVGAAFLIQASSEFTDYGRWSMITWGIYFATFLLDGVALLAFGFGMQIVTWEYPHDDSYTMARPSRASMRSFLVLFGSMIVLFAYSIMSRTFELMLWSFLPLSLTWASLLISAFAQRLFGRPRFQRAQP